MTYEKRFQEDLMDEVLSWSSEKIYSVFGNYLEKVVLDEKEKMQRKLKTIWRNRTWYAFRDTNEQFDKDTMRLYFDPKKISKYKNYELESILENIEEETNYSNPKK